MDWLRQLGHKPEHHDPPEVEKAKVERDEALLAAGESLAVAVEAVEEVDRVSALWKEYERAERRRRARR